MRRDLAGSGRIDKEHIIAPIVPVRCPTDSRLISVLFPQCPEHLGVLALDPAFLQQLVQISVEAEATAIPPAVEVSVEGMAVGDSVHASDLRLPAGVTLAIEPDVLVLHVIAAPTAAQIQAELGEGEALAAAAEVPAAVPEAAAPAAETASAEESG